MIFSYVRLTVSTFGTEEGTMARTDDEYKQLSVKEFTKAAKVYESGHAGIYEMCKDDYPQYYPVGARAVFRLLDVGCGTGAVIELLHGKHPGARYVGLDLTPDMIAVAKAKGLDGCEFVVGRTRRTCPSRPASSDAVLTSNSFHHYPNSERFFAGVHRVLRPGGRLILRDYTANDFAVDRLMNTFELPLARLVGHGDVRILKKSEFTHMAQAAGFEVLAMEARKRLPRTLGCAKKLTNDLSPCQVRHGRLSGIFSALQRVAIVLRAGSA